MCETSPPRSNEPEDSGYHHQRQDICTPTSIINNGIFAHVLLSELQTDWQLKGGGHSEIIPRFFRAQSL